MNYCHWITVIIHTLSLIMTVDMLNDKLVNLDWHAYADQVYDRRENGLLENYYNQRQWKCNLLLGLDTHYTPITSLK